MPGTPAAPRRGRSGRQAIATGSASVAGAHGFADAENLPLDLALANAERVVAAVDLPVTIDFEGGYAIAPEGSPPTGGAGSDRRDRLQFRGPDGRRRGAAPDAEQAARIAAMRRAVRPDFFINARTDIFLKAKAGHPREAMVDAACARRRPMPTPARAASSCRCWPTSAAGALLQGLAFAGQFHGLARTPRRDVAATGVARISHGPFPWKLAMNALKDAATAEYGG